MVKVTKLGIAISLILTIMGCGASQPTATTPTATNQSNKDKSKETKPPEQTATVQKIPPATNLSSTTV